MSSINDATRLRALRKYSLRTLPLPTLLAFRTNNICI
uniref:Uncharacterized protein n=1 Tax=Anguilla anguilla TaxID=7936 RepID=A0A0E9SCL5_ANGAN